MDKTGMLDSLIRHYTKGNKAKFATMIGSRLTGVLYVLDEPSIGLHQRDNRKLIDSLLKMRDLGNSLIVVEHDTDTMLASDYLVDIGPLAGDNGGLVMACGTPEEVMQDENSLTGKYLTGKYKIEIPEKRRKGNKKYLEVKDFEETISSLIRDLVFEASDIACWVFAKKYVSG